MINEINYLRMKKALLKYFRKSNVHIEIKGTIITRFIIQKARITINKHKLIISNEDLDATIFLDFIKKAKIDDITRIELIGLDAQYILEV
jgi:hypothetical protein